MNKIKLFLVFAIGFMFAMSAWAQTEESRMKEILDDEMAIEESGVYTLRFFDAVTGNPVEGGVVDVDHLAKFTTDMSGKVTFDATTPDGAYVAKFTKNGYITANYNFEILAGTIMYNRFSVCPSLKFGEMRVVLEWGKRPKDLDAHLVKQGGYHISFRDMAVAQDGSARLDRDDTNGEGPETITILKVDPKASRITSYNVCYTKLLRVQSNF